MRAGRPGRGSVTVQGRWDSGLEGSRNGREGETEDVGSISGMLGRSCPVRDEREVQVSF